jgi:alkaline phosphatase D
MYRPSEATVLLLAAILSATLLTPGTRPAVAGEMAPVLASDALLSRIGLGSCADQNRPQPVWEPILAAEPQLMLMIGDNVYGDVRSAEMVELETAYARLATVPGFVRLRARVPILAIWDDHDYGRNDAGADFPFKHQAAALFRQFWEIPANSPRSRREGLYDAAVFGPPGRRVQVILLDTRWFRSPLRPTDRRGAAGRERYLPDWDPAKTMLGPAQWAWLAEELARPAELRLIVSSIQVLADGHGWERWGNLPLERARLYDTIANARAGGVIFASGDRHVGGFYRVDGALPYPLIEITSSSLNRPFRDADEPGPNRLGELVRDENFGLVAIDWQRREIALELRDLGGKPVRSLSVALADLRFSR